MGFTAKLDEFFVADAQEQDHRVRIGQLTQDGIDLGLGLDVEPPGRVGQQQASWFDRKPFRQNDFLPVASRQG